MAWSQRNGRVKKYAGDISTQGTPLKIGCSNPPINPMSWYSGNQLTITSSGLRSIPKPRRINSSLATRLPWVTCTPLGNAVEPEVYCKKATSSACNATLCQCCAWVGSSSSTQSKGGDAGSASASMPSKDSRNGLLVSSRRGWASVNIDSNRS